jgi:hypothetical protein
MVAVTAKVPRDFRAQIDELTSDDEPRSAVMRRLIRTGLEQHERSPVRKRIMTSAGYLILSGLPTYLAYTGDAQGAALTILVALISFNAAPYLT